MKTNSGKSLRITFYNNRRNIYPPLGICYLSAFLKTNGYRNVSLVDRHYENNEDVVRTILRLKPDVVGVSTYSVGVYDIMEVSKRLKQEAPGIIILWGGPHITSIPEVLPHYADIGIIGEGEETLLEIIEGLASSGMTLDAEWLKNIKGISFHNGEKVTITERRPLLSNLDCLPFPDYSILDTPWYTAPKRYFVMPWVYRGITVMSSRGCPYKCVFCQASRQWEKIRFHSPEYIVNAMLEIRHTYPYINAINIVDDIFTADKKRLAKITRLMKEAGLDKGISYNINGRTDIVDEEILGILKSINIVQISYGFESGSQKILSYLKKNTVSVEDNERTAEATNKHGIGVGGQFMVGTPGETREDLLKTAYFIKKHKMSHAHLSVTTPLPGTELWEYAKEKGLVSEDMDWRRVDFGNPDNPNLVYINDALPKNEFEKLKNMVQGLCNRYNKPDTLSEKIQIILGKRFAWRSVIKSIISRTRGRG